MVAPFKVGSIINVTVTQVETFGLFCNHKGFKVMVLIPNISWIASFADCNQFASPGESFNVKVLGIDNERKEAGASIKDLSPESNPWSGAWKIIEGSQIDVNVLKFVEKADRCNYQSGFLVELKPGALAMLCSDNPSIVVGESCTVRVSKINSQMRSIELIHIDR